MLDHAVLATPSSMVTVAVPQNDYALLFNCFKSNVPIRLPKLPKASTRSPGASICSRWTCLNEVPGWRSRDGLAEGGIVQHGLSGGPSGQRGSRKYCPEGPGQSGLSPHRHAVVTSFVR